MSRWLPLFGDRADGFKRDEREAARVLMRRAGVGLAMTAALFRLTWTNCRASELHEARDRADGSDLDGWLRADQEIALAEAPAA